MPAATSKITAQGQISVPAEVRRKLGVGPGSILEWEERDGQMIVRRVGRYSCEDIHKAIFPEGPPKHRTLEELKEGIADYVRDRYGRK